MTRRRTTLLAAVTLGLGLAAAPASAEPLALRVHSGDQPLFVQHPWHREGNPNVTPANPMGVVGWNGPPDTFDPGVLGEAGPLPAGSIADAQTGGWNAFY